MKRVFAIALSCVVAASCCNQTKESYVPEWSSLSQHQTPQWLMDAKFGIYCHWGPQSVMEEYRHTEKIDILEGYKRWNADKFDGAEWAELFKNTGAHFAGMIGQHCSGCLNWDSEVTSWNTVNYGPKIDILGELIPEIRKRGMNTMASFHTVTYGSIWGERSKSDRTFHEPIMAFDSINRIDTSWQQGWIDRIDEATNKYDLDMIWFDTSFGRSIAGELKGFIKEGKYIHKQRDARRGSTRIGGMDEATQQKIIADYYNYGLKKGKDVEVVYKANDLPHNIGMRDIENGNLDGAQYDPWMTDINMLKLHPKYWSNWFYDPGCPLKDANMIVDMIIDVASKNGRMLLSVPPHSDGSFAQPVLDELAKIGEWMSMHNDVLYASTPWGLYGEGPTVVKHPGHHGQTQKRGLEIAEFTSDDIRYMSKGGDLFVYVLGLPQSGSSKMDALGYENKLYPNEIKSIELIGSSAKVEWKHESDHLEIIFPKGVKDQPAYCFRIVR